MKTGILGFAHGHVRSYLDRWLASPAWGVEVVGGWDHDAERLRGAVECYGFTAYETAEALLADTSIGAVVITAETALHAELVEKAAAAGKSIVLQKPIAITLAEADGIVDAVERHGARFTMAWQMRVDPQNLEMKALLEGGTLGRPFMLRRRHGLPVCLRREFASSWHVAPQWNRDIWADDAAHPFDFVYWLFGMPETITAELVSLHNPAMPMDNGIAVMRYAGDGPLVEVCCSFTNLASENTTEVICEKGSIVQNYGDVPSCNVPRPEGAPGLKWFIGEEGQWYQGATASPAGHGERIAGLAEPLARFLRGEAPAIATAAEGRDVLRMILACYVSAREGRRVAMDDPKIVDV